MKILQSQKENLEKLNQNQNETLNQEKVKASGLEESIQKLKNEMQLMISSSDDQKLKEIEKTYQNVLESGKSRFL